MSLIGDMTTAVITHINKGMSFKSSFAEVAHQHGIRHYKDEAQYNHIFGRVMIAVKRKMGRGSLVRPVKISLCQSRELIIKNSLPTIND